MWHHLRSGGWRLVLNQWHSREVAQGAVCYWYGMYACCCPLSLKLLEEVLFTANDMPPLRHCMRISWSGFVLTFNIKACFDTGLGVDGMNDISCSGSLPGPPHFPFPLHWDAQFSLSSHKTCRYCTRGLRMINVVTVGVDFLLGRKCYCDGLMALLDVDCLAGASLALSMFLSFWFAVFKADLNSETSVSSAAISLLSSTMIDELASMEHAAQIKDEVMAAQWLCGMPAQYLCSRTLHKQQFRALVSLAEMVSAQPSQECWQRACVSKILLCWADDLFFPPLLTFLGGIASG